jgi:glutamate-1-semialdehyde 2,1-aminomutase
MLCLRVAHTATGKPKVLKFEGAYHGQHPVGVTSMLNGRPTALPHSDPSGAGAAWVERDVLVAPFNDLATTEQILRDHAHELAAVIVEPLHRCIAPRKGFLEGLRDVTRRLGIILVFDEVVTGFRLALGGAQEYYGVTPDLVAYGKALGGGFPIGAYAGRADLMETVSEHRLPGPHYVWSASTGGGNPVSCAAALATIDVLSEPGIHSSLHQSGARLRQRMAEVLTSKHETAQILGDGPLAQVAFSAAPVVDQQSWLASDRKRGRAVMLELLRRGVFLNPMGTKLYLSLSHNDGAIDEFVQRFDEALR